MKAAFPSTYISKVGLIQTKKAPTIKWTKWYSRLHNMCAVCLWGRQRVSFNSDIWSKISYRHILCLWEVNLNILIFGKSVLSFSSSFLGAGLVSTLIITLIPQPVCMVLFIIWNNLPIHKWFSCEKIQSNFSRSHTMKLRGNKNIE